MITQGWDELRKNKAEVSKVLKEAGLSPALAQLRWAALTKSDRLKIGRVTLKEGKGWHEEPETVITKKGVEQKAPVHRKVAVKASLETTLRKPMVEAKEPEPIPEQVTVAREELPEQIPEPKPEPIIIKEEPLPEKIPIVREVVPEPIIVPSPAPVVIPEPIPAVIPEISEPPWELTLKQYEDIRTKAEGKFSPEFRKDHKSFIIEALEHSKTIPDRVLTDYPSLRLHDKKLALIREIRGNLTIPDPRALWEIQFGDLHLINSFLDRAEWYKFDVTTDEAALDRLKFHIKKFGIVHESDLDAVKANFHGTIKSIEEIVKEKFPEKPQPEQKQPEPVVKVTETEAVGERHVAKKDEYREKIRVTLESLGTIRAEEWKATGFVYNKNSENCQLCGHSIMNVYILTKVAGANIGKQLSVGSDCVMNYIGIPIDKAEFDIKFNPDGKFKEKVKETQDNLNRLTSPSNKDYENRNYWETKKEIITKYATELEAQGYLAPSHAERIIEYQKKTIEDLTHFNAAITAAELAHDKLKPIMEESKQFHSTNTFIRSIYEQWMAGRQLSGKQESSFIAAVERLKSISNLKEPIGQNSATGKMTNFRESYIQTKRGSKQKLIFDVGAIPNISIVEWIQGFELAKTIRDSKKEVEVKILYSFDGNYRNVIENGITSLETVVPIWASDVPDSEVQMDRFLPIHPRNWQLSCFKNWYFRGEGIVNPNDKSLISAGTGSGKTVLGAMSVRYLLHENQNLTVLIVVPAIVLQKQWYDTLIKSGISAEVIGFVGGLGTPDGFKQITIAVLNSIRNMELIDIYGKPYDLFIGDEAHHLSSEAAQNNTILENNSFGRMMLFSATPGEALEQKYGKICEVSEKELLDEGTLSQYQITNIAVTLPSSDLSHYYELTAMAQRYGGMETNLGKKYYGERSRFIQNHPEKVARAIQLVKDIQFDSAIALFTTTKSVDEFVESMQSMNPPVSAVSYHSKMTDIQRAINLKKFETGEARMLVGAFAIGEGLDVPDAETMIVVGGTSKERQWIQRTGRVKRIAEGKGVAQIFQIYAKETMEENYVKKRLATVPEGIPIRYI